MVDLLSLCGSICSDVTNSLAIALGRACFGDMSVTLSLSDSGLQKVFDSVEKLYWRHLSLIITQTSN